MEIIGLRIENYIGKGCEGSNCDFKYFKKECKRHILLCLSDNNEKIEIDFHEDEGECGSGWCTASWAYVTFNKVDKFNGYTHKPKNRIIIDEINRKIVGNTFKNQVFEYSYCGEDDYYPSGYYRINMDLFNTNPRHKEKRITYIFTGESGIGKSFLAEKLSNYMIIYETDISENLPDKIIADIVVLGNKYHYTIKDIRERVSDTEIVVVNFNKG